MSFEFVPGALYQVTVFHISAGRDLSFGGGWFGLTKGDVVIFLRHTRDQYNGDAKWFLTRYGVLATPSWAPVSDQMKNLT
jgi:hypothetical protein